MFAWLSEVIEVGSEHEEGVGGLIDDEFDMRLLHQSKRNG